MVWEVPKWPDTLLELSNGKKWSGKLLNGKEMVWEAPKWEASQEGEGGSLQEIPLYSNRQLMCLCGVEAARPTHPEFVGL